ncbi:hypothetical protein GCM10018953_44530 [Streptosporangium nondiastaticum]
MPVTSRVVAFADRVYREAGGPHGDRGRDGPAVGGDGSCVSGSENEDAVLHFPAAVVCGFAS